jgi:hypothetical protein
MAKLSLQNFQTLVQNFASVVQGSASQLLDFTTGSVLLAVGEATASLSLWLQWLILLVLQTTRLGTSAGADVDSWGADYQFTRLPATLASGPVTFYRYTPTLAAYIAPGVQVKTADGTQLFSVVEDTTQSAWNSSLGSYVIGAGVSSANVTVQAVNSGSQANVQAGTITLLASAVAGVDYVSNPANFANGIDAETDAAFKARWQNYISSRTLGTLAAIDAAIAGVQQGLNWSIQENSDTTGAFVPGFFIITVDDGSGAPPSSLLAAITTAVFSVRPIGSRFFVQGPQDTLATLTMAITATPASKKAALIPQVQAAIVAYVNALPVGATLIYDRIPGVAYAVDPAISEVSLPVLNGGQSDIVPSASGAVKATLSSVTIS